MLAAAGLVPLLWVWAFRDPFGVPKFLLASAATAASIAASLRGSGPRAFSSSLDGPLLAFCAVFLLSAAFSVDPWLSWTGPDRAPLAAMPGVALCAAGFFAGRAAAREGTLARLSFWTAAGAAAAGAFAVAERFGFKATLFVRADAARAISTVGSPTALAATLAFGLPFAAREFWAGRGARRAFGAAAVLAAACGLWLSGSRGAWAAAALGTAAALWLRRPRSLREKRVAAALGAAVFAAGLAGWAAGWGGRSGDLPRLMAWKIAARQFLETPWLGSGPGTFTLAFRGRSTEALAALSRGNVSFPHAHNDWLEIAASVGAAGVAAFAWLHWRAGRRLAASLPEKEGAAREVLAAYSGAAAALLIGWKFNFPGIGAAWLASVWSGAVFAPETGAKAFPAAAPAAVIACLFACGFAFWDASAERLDQAGRFARAAGESRAAAGYFHRAVGLNPGRIAYRLDLLNTLWDAAEESPELLEAAVQVAADGVRRRPAEPETHRMLGLALRRLGKLGPARAALETAVALAPGMRFGLRDLAETAKLQGDAARVRELEDRLKRITHEDSHNGASVPLGGS